MALERYRSPASGKITTIVFPANSSSLESLAAARLSNEEEFAGKTIVVILPDAGERYLSSAMFDHLED